MGWILSLLAIIAIDLVLAGDNAVVMAMATRKLPGAQRKKALVFGALGAVVVRVLLTFVVTFLLKIPLLMAVGGLLLIQVAYKLLVEEEEEDKDMEVNGFMHAIKTIILADVIMSLDNMLAVAGASHGSFALILIGLAISIPVVILGSQIISNYMNKYPILVTAGAAIIAYTAAKMIVHDSIIDKFVFDFFNMFIELGIVALVIVSAKVKKLRLS
jgi:YjbE family integral membrane protein